MRVVKCDRCGEVMNPKNSLEVRMFCEALIGLHAHTFSAPEAVKREGFSVDLCLECAAMLRAWMKPL